MTTTGGRAAGQQAQGPAQPRQAVQSAAARPLSADVPRQVTATTAEDRFAVLGCIIAAAGLVWVVYDRLLGLSGWVGFLACWYAVFLALYWAVSAMEHPRPVVVDRLVAAAIHGAAVLVVVAVSSTIFYTFVEGRHALVHLNFYTQDMSATPPNAPLTQGGISHAIEGTLVEVLIATAISLPLGVGTAVF